jgi:hypothetical protein
MHKPVMDLTALLLAAATAQQAVPNERLSTPEDQVVVEGRRILPSVGLMNDHLHTRGEFMIGVRYQHFDWGGATRHGTRKISDEALMDAGYMMRAKTMTMDMAMVDLMYGISDNLTVTFSPQYVSNRMKTVGTDPMDPMIDGMTSHGLGDTLASASLRLAKGDRVSAHATLGVWIPTGKSGLKDDGTFMQYCMQTGSGTWDLEPSATVKGQDGRLGWGAQASFRFRAEHRNNAGYRLGNKALLTGWVSYLVGATVRVTARAEYVHQGRIDGGYDGMHMEDMPQDFPANFGGDMATGAVGLNWEPMIGEKRGPQLGVELGVPLYQNVNGVQLPQRWQLSAGIRQFF